MGAPSGLIWKLCQWQIASNGYFADRHDTKSKLSVNLYPNILTIEMLFLGIRTLPIMFKLFTNDVGPVDLKIPINWSVYFWMFSAMTCWVAEHTKLRCPPAVRFKVGNWKD